MLIKTSKESIKHALEYLVKIPFAKEALHRITESARGKCIAFFSIHRVLADAPESLFHPHYIHKTAITERQAVKHLRYINQKLPFISLVDSLEFLLGKRPLDRSHAVLLIENAYVETIRHISPFLIEHKIPAAIALNTQSIEDGRMPWIDEIIFRLGQTAVKNLSLNFMDRSFQLRSIPERLQASHHIIHYLSQSSPEVIQARSKEICDQLSEVALPPTSERICTLHQLEKLSLNPLFSFMCAGRNRLPLATMSRAEAHKELMTTKSDLNACLSRGVLPIYFSQFAFDKKGHQEFSKFMQDDGYQAAISPKVGLARPGDNMFRLKRLPLAQGLSSFEQFELQGLSDAIDEMLLVTLGREDRQENS